MEPHLCYTKFLQEQRVARRESCFFCHLVIFHTQDLGIVPAHLEINGSPRPEVCGSPTRSAESTFDFSSRSKTWQHFANIFNKIPGWCKSLHTWCKSLHTFAGYFFFWRNVDEVGEMLPYLAPRRKVKHEVCKNGQVIHAPLDKSFILFSRCTGTIPSSWR